MFSSLPKLQVYEAFQYRQQFLNGTYDRSENLPF